MSPRRTQMKSLTALGLLSLAIGPLHGQTSAPLVSEVSVLTIHVSDTNTHDAVFHFLTDVLELPVDYGPEMLGGAGMLPFMRVTCS